MDILLNSTDMETVRACFLFRGVDDIFIRRALDDDLCRLETFQKGEVIYDINNYRRHVGLILTGDVEVVKPSADGKKFIMNDLHPKSLFGAAAVFNETNDYVTRLTAKRDSRIIFFPQELLKALMQENFTVAENYIAFLSGRIQFLNNKISNLILPGTGNALAKWLFENAVFSEDSYFIELKGSISSLSAMLNIGRASLYRAFETLENAGIIAKNGKKIEILDIEQLKHYI